MPSDLRVRLRRYSPEGVRGAVIDYSSLAVSMPASDAFVITNCTVSSRSYAALSFPMLAGLEWSTGEPDAPVPGGLYLLSTDSYDEASTARVHSITGAQYVPLMLGGAKVYPSAEALAAEGGSDSRQLSGTPGAIMLQLVEEAQERGWMPDLVLGFTATLDSDGNAWDTTVPSFTITLGHSLWALLTNLVKMQACEFTADFVAGEHVLDLWNPDSGADLSGSVTIAPDATAIPIKQDYSNVATHIIGQLDDGTLVERAVVGAPTTFGRVEAWVSLSGITDPTYAAELLASMDAGAAAPAKELSITRQALGALKLPLRDYVTGDIVRYRADGGNWTNGRIVQLTLTCEGPKVTVQETFGTVIRDTAERVLGLVAGATGGVSRGGSGSGSPPAPVLPNPVAPTGLSATGVGYWDENGQPQGKVELTWNAVTLSEAGTSILVDRYEVLIRDTALGLTETYAAAAAFENELTLTTGFPIGSAWEAQVVAVSAAGGRSAPSAADTFTIPAPAIDVVAPVAPDVTLGIGMALVVPVWEQATTPSPTAMPEQVSSLRVYASPDGSTGWVLAGTAMSNGDDVKFVRPIAEGFGDEWWFAATAVTSDGQESARGDATSITIEGISIPDLAGPLATILTGPLIETDPGVELGVKVSAGGIVAYDELGEVTMLVDASNGTVYFRDGLISGSVIAAGTIQATAIEAGTAFVDLIQSISDQLDLAANTSVQVIIGNALAPVQSQVDGLDSELVDQRVYFTFDANGFTVSEPGDPMAFRVGAGEASILANGNVVSYWNESQLVVPSILIEEGTIGKHQVSPDGSDGTVFRAVG
jgi:hypothetical protein